MSRSDTAVWFQRAYSGNPICSPTRASLLTGRTPARTCIYAVEQHILCREGADGCARGELSVANLTQAHQYLSGFFGKWHLGSLSDRGVGSPDCYAKPSDQSCQLGYWEKDGGCCFGTDGAKLQVSHPLQFGFDEFVATPECAASATSNCGCFFYPSAHNDSACELGHYAPTHSVPYHECMQYYKGSAHADGSTTVEPLTSVSGVDDEDWLIDHVERLVDRGEAEQRPFLAVVFFHGVHIPYVATPAMRAKYVAKGFDANEADYWGTISQIDAAVGRVRALLQARGIANNTWLSLTADNGPEVNPSGGQGTGSYANPGRTAGLRGRKRDVTEGGTRVIGLVEYPPAVSPLRARVEPYFPISTMDLFPTVADLLGLDPPALGRPLDGISLLPVLRGEMATRPQHAGIGIHGSFPYGDTNHQLDPATGQLVVPFRCPKDSASARLGDIPVNFASAAHGGWQFSWAEGNELKLFGCSGYCNGNNCNSTAPGFANPGWHFFLYNLTADRTEDVDLWEPLRPKAQAMLGRFLEWQQSVLHSQGADEIGCAL